MFAVFTTPLFTEALVLFSSQCGRSTSTQPTQTICLRAQRMARFCTGRLLRIQTCRPIYKVNQVIRTDHSSRLCRKKVIRVHQQTPDVNNIKPSLIKCSIFQFFFLKYFSGGRNNSMISRSAMAPAGGNQSLISTWLSGDSSKARLETTHMLPSQTLSVNSLDILGQCLVCGTDGEAIFVNRQVPV